MHIHIIKFTRPGTYITSLGFSRAVVAETLQDAVAQILHAFPGAEVKSSASHPIPDCITHVDPSTGSITFSGLSPDTFQFILRESLPQITNRRNPKA